MDGDRHSHGGKGGAHGGGGSVFQEKARSWRAVIRINGKPVKRRATSQEAAQALLEELRQLKQASERQQRPIEDVLADVKALRDVGVNIRAGTQTIETWLDTWHAAMERTLSPRSRQNNRYVIDGYLVPLLGAEHLSAVTADTIQAALNRVQDDIVAAHTNEDTGEVRFTGERTVKALYQVLNAAFKLAVERRLIPFNPMGGVRIPVYRRTSPPALTLDQLLAFLAAADDHALGPMWWTYALLGLRRGEGMGLSWDDIDLAGRTIHVRRQIQHIGTSLKSMVPKRHAIRLLPLPAPVSERLEPMRLEWLKGQLKHGPAWNPDRLLFVTRDGGPWWPSNLTWEFRAVANASGLPAEATIHGLRHTVGTLLAEAGTSEVLIGGLLGHQKKNVTQGYIHARVPAMRVAQDAMLAMIFPTANWASDQA